MPQSGRVEGEGVWWDEGVVGIKIIHWRGSIPCKRVWGKLCLVMMQV